MELAQQSFGLGRIVLHAEAPDKFLGSDDADARWQAFGAPGNRGIAAQASLVCRVLLCQILGVLVQPGRFLEVGPGMTDNPVVAGHLPWGVFSTVSTILRAILAGVPARSRLFACSQIE